MCACVGVWCAPQPARRCPVWSGVACASTRIGQAKVPGPSQGFEVSEDAAMIRLTSVNVTSLRPHLQGVCGFNSQFVAVQEHALTHADQKPMT
eukprot:10588182-Alexandrium_andersonii.AAC.1